MTAKAWLLTAVAAVGQIAVARAQVSPADQACISALNGGVREVAKQHGKIVGRCLRSFASGSLPTTVEACVITDVGGRIQRANDKAVASTTAACTGAAPTFGVSPLGPALARGALGEIELMHGSLGIDLDAALIPTALAAGCQARVAGALLKCADVRRKTFTKCQTAGLRAGTIVDAATLESSCLGTGNSTQPDSSGAVGKVCGLKVARMVARCTGVDLAQAFPACGTSDPNALTTCLTGESGCQLCRLANDVDGLARDCDRFDDGNGSNGSCGPECADAIVQLGEGCDDGDATGGDGCSATCDVEPGWSCSGSPSVCTPECGDSTLDAGESCDDGDTAGGDGCSSACTVESGYTCAGEPSVCTRNCGNGTVSAPQGEACDDGDGTSGDGCSASCQVEPGWICSGQPSVCTFVCGNGTFQAG